jgi:hypothetical protein
MNLRGDFQEKLSKCFSFFEMLLNHTAYAFISKVADFRWSLTSIVLLISVSRVLVVNHLVWQIFPILQPSSRKVSVSVTGSARTWHVFPNESLIFSSGDREWIIPSGAPVGMTSALITMTRPSSLTPRSSYLRDGLTTLDRTATLSRFPKEAERV